MGAVDAGIRGRGERMNIHGLTTGLPTSEVDAIGGPKGGREPAPPPADEIGPAARARVSDMASFMAELSALKDSDPEAFKAKLNDLSSQAREAAYRTSGEPAKRLSRMADKLTEVAQSGEVSALQPPPPGAGRPGRAAGHGGPQGEGGAPPPGGGRPPGGGGAAKGGLGPSSSASSTADDSKFDSADTNEDGVVTDQEQHDYEAKHPEKAAG